jgi:putative IMPACT (imprinted ancient) family translation regulator
MFEKLPSEILVPATIGESKYKEKGSVFLGAIYGVESAGAAEARLAELRKTRYDATHVCYAYKIVGEDPRHSDDGEPSGSAGARILNALERRGLVNALGTVTRYYGGTKLGVGPLGRAYYQAAKEAAEATSVRKKTLFAEVRAEFDYSHTSPAYHALNVAGASIFANESGARQVVRARVLPSAVASLDRDLRDATGAKAKLTVGDSPVYLEA